MKKICMKRWISWILFFSDLCEQCFDISNGCVACILYSVSSTTSTHINNVEEHEMQSEWFIIFHFSSKNFTCNVYSTIMIVLIRSYNMTAIATYNCRAHSVGLQLWHHYLCECVCLCSL